MSEEVLPAVQDALQEQRSSGQMTAGAMLKGAREAAGLHIGALAVSLKVPVKKLAALEDDRFDLLPDIVFVRALASSVCRTLKIDPEPVLEKLPSTAAPRLRTDEAGINVPFRAPGVVRGLLSSEHLSRPIVLGVLALLVGALVIVFLPATEVTEVAQALKFDAAAVISPDLSSAPAPALTPDLSAVPKSVPEATPAAATAALPEPKPVLLTTPEPRTAPTDDVIVFEARGASWVQVVDANDVVISRTTLQEGETLRASGALPISVVVGRADQVVVRVRGKPFDLSAVAKSNVARFEVK